MMNSLKVFEGDLCLNYETLIVMVILSLVTKCNAQMKAGIEDTARICTLPLNHGIGEGSYIRWYFDSGSASCTEFKFKGIGGNENNFKTIEECQTNCPCPKVTVQENCMVYLLAKNSIGCPIPSKIECRPLKSNSIQKCLEPVDHGPCTPYYKRWFFNETSGQCEHFLFGGCGGNGNNFESHFSCSFLCRNIKTTTVSTAEKTSMPIPSRCNEVKDTGPCSTRIQRWYYNSERKQCDTFDYSGCEGNGNNFHSLDQCNSICRVRETVAYSTTTSSEDSTLVSDTREDSKATTQLSQDFGSGTANQHSTELPEQFTFHLTDDLVVRVLPQTSETPPSFSESQKSNNGISSSPAFKPLTTTTMIYDTTTKSESNFNSSNGGLNSSNHDLIMTSFSPLHVQVETDQQETFTSQSPTHFSIEPAAVRSSTNNEIATGKVRSKERFINFPLQTTKLHENRRILTQTETLQTVASTIGTNEEKSDDIISSDNVFFENQLRTISKVLRVSFGTFPVTLPPVETQINLGTTDKSKTPLNQFRVHPSTKLLQTTELIQTNSDFDVNSQGTTAATSDSAAEEVCLLPSETGKCSESHNRYFFNKFRGQCERFNYSGCNGNKNNFESWKNCQYVCREFIGSLYVKFSPPELV